MGITLATADRWKTKLCKWISTWLDRVIPFSKDIRITIKDYRMIWPEQSYQLDRLDA